ncbi:hypothetical protein M9H77_34887 [Catharanthus roseus]|uniref:Uncharacterized protein n=1 Tax=Catharanthus roseus TaxID=4058 RepID=A0ACB9ZPL6_CATRO|nr:hypothetical protein M9H77_34887 [Catharanthus roseus]
MAQSSKFLAALWIGILLGNVVDIEESVIVSCNIEVQLRRFGRIRKISTSINRGTQLSVSRSVILRRNSTREKTAVHEVVLWFNGVEDLKGFKIKQLVLRKSLEELKGFNCAAWPNCITNWCILCIKDDHQEKVNITFYSCQYQNPNCHLMTV